MDVKVNQEELKAFTKEQGNINESLCTENIAARWAWKSGELKSGSMVPWEIQLSNTLPDNFLWEKDKTNVLTVAPGLYEVSLLSIIKLIKKKDYLWFLCKEEAYSTTFSEWGTCNVCSKHSFVRIRKGILFLIVFL